MGRFQRRTFLVAASALCGAGFVSAQSRTYRVGFIGFSETLAGGPSQALLTERG
jgi:hypothetical protein